MSEKEYAEAKTELDIIDILKLTGNDPEVVESLFLEHYPIDIAIALSKGTNEQIQGAFDSMQDDQAAQVLEQAEWEFQLRIVGLLQSDRIIRILSNMSKDDVVDILGDLPIQKSKELLKLMKNGESVELQKLLGYKEDSAGGIMTTEYIALNSRLTMNAALKKIKEIGPKTEVIETIFVLNRNKQLVGTADLREIFLAGDDEQLSAIMDDNVISVAPETDQEEVALIVSKYDLKAIPVVNRNQSLLGIITVDDIIDVIVEENTEDMLRLGGISGEESVNSPLSVSIKQRLPWLFVNLVTAFLAASTVSLFESVIAQVVALAAAMPIVAGMGGNAGTQTLSVVIRSITLGEATLRQSYSKVIKEVALGAVNGAAIGIVTGLVVYLRYGNVYLGLIIFAAMIGNLVIAGFFGFLLPLILKSLKIDPALASSIFLTTATDVFGFFLFLGLAQMFLPLLL